MRIPDPLSIYHALPYSLKVVAASLWGARLSAQRYGHETDEDVEAALARESWNSLQWQTWRENRLSRMLYHAATHVPFYREQWSRRRRHGDQSAVENLENWPVLDKDALRSRPEAFIADGLAKRQLIPDHTSGSSGVPLSLWIDRKAVQAWYALFEARWRRWYGLSRYDRWGILGGRLVTAFSRSQPPFWVWNAGMRQLYLSTFHISPRFISHYVDAIRQHRLVYLLGYASSLYDVARLINEQGLQPPVLQAVLSNAEALFPHQREAISRAFGCPVYDTYGQAENVCAASECSAGQMHLWPEVGITEVYADFRDEPVPAGDVGRLVVTGLLNTAMPLIRYDVGDRGSLLPEDLECQCGRRLPRLGSIDGRIEDVLVTPDGRCIEPDIGFLSHYPVREAQVVQETVERICVRVIPGVGFSPGVAAQLEAEFRNRFGDMQILINEVAEIPRTRSGKRKVLVSKLSHHTE